MNFLLAPISSTCMVFASGSHKLPWFHSSSRAWFPYNRYTALSENADPMVAFNLDAPKGQVKHAVQCALAQMKDLCQQDIRFIVGATSQGAAVAAMAIGLLFNTVENAEKYCVGGLLHQPAGVYPDVLKEFNVEGQFSKPVFRWTEDDAVLSTGPNHGIWTNATRQHFFRICNDAKKQNAGFFFRTTPWDGVTVDLKSCTLGPKTRAARLLRLMVTFYNVRSRGVTRLLLNK